MIRAKAKPVFVPVLMLALLAAFTFWIYAPGIEGPVMLDDRSSLGKLENLAESPEQALELVLGENSGPLGRPVSMATFVLENLAGDGTLGTAKTVNILLHLLVGAVMACCFALLLSASGSPAPVTAAILFVGFWLLAPLHVSTVLYVVQRMAMLSTLFSLLALLSYLFWRRGISRGEPHHGVLSLVALNLVLAVFSKENGVLAIPLILLTEAFWLQFRDDAGRSIAWLRRGTLLLIGSGALALLLLLVIFWDTLGQYHAAREFTLQERLLTQARVLWDYVGQFYVPELARLGIYHDDVELSRSLWQPVSTAYAAAGLGIVLLFVPVLWRCPWPRRLLYGPLFFLAGHAMESTVWPLELYFEHRNYLPSVGLAVVPLCVYAIAVQRWPEVRRPLLGWALVAIAAVSFQLSSQVAVWSSRPLLMMHQVNGHPESARANRDYATLLASVGAREAALSYSRRAYQSALDHPAASDEHFGDYLLRNVALACMARQPLLPQEYAEPGSLDRDRPFGQVFTMSVIIKLRQNNACPAFDWDTFLAFLGDLYLDDFDTSKASANMFSALAMLSNAHQNWEFAHAYTARQLALEPESVRGMLMQLHFATAMGQSAEAEAYIARLQELQREGKLTQGEQANLALYVEK